MNQQNPGQGNNNQPQGGGHPAWQEYLKDVPEALQPVVKSAFEKWDQNVTQRFQEIHNQYAPLKQFQPLLQNNIPLERVGQALQFANELERDPKAMVQRMNQQLNLGFVPSDQVQRQTPKAADEYDAFDEGSANFDPTQHPMFQQMQQTLQQMQEHFSQQQQQDEEEAQQEQFEAYLNSLLATKTHLDNDDNRMLITAFMSQGLSGEDALSRVESSYVGQMNQQINQQLPNSDNGGQQPQITDLQQHLEQQLGQQGSGNGEAPVVMGGSGTAGSGTPQNTIDFGNMKTDDINSLVADMLDKTQNS